MSLPVVNATRVRTFSLDGVRRLLEQTRRWMHGWAPSTMTRGDFETISKRAGIEKFAAAAEIAAGGTGNRRVLFGSSAPGRRSGAQRRVAESRQAWQLQSSNAVQNQKAASAMRQPSREIDSTETKGGVKSDRSFIRHTAKNVDFTDRNDRFRLNGICEIFDRYAIPTLKTAPFRNCWSWSVR